ncbi:hypothetical protein TNCV_4146301 [Trichonephila clavipes]|nr:hypothetical protein TNCV_4146301 [Trichonephila clavipes]
MRSRQEPLKIRHAEGPMRVNRPPVSVMSSVDQNSKLRHPSPKALPWSAILRSASLTKRVRPSSVDQNS